MIAEVGWSAWVQAAQHVTEVFHDDVRVVVGLQHVVELPRVLPLHVFKSDTHLARQVLPASGDIGD